LAGPFPRYSDLSLQVLFARSPTASASTRSAGGGPRLVVQKGRHHAKATESGPDPSQQLLGPYVLVPTQIAEEPHPPLLLGLACEGPAQVIEALADERCRRRFAIETSYRQLHQARIRTCTRSPLLRLLYVGVALLLRNEWVWLPWEVLAERRRGQRRLHLSRLSFRRMLLWWQHYAEKWLGVYEEIHAQRPVWG
jgi:hypothetical protein